MRRFISGFFLIIIIYLVWMQWNSYYDFRLDINGKASLEKEDYPNHLISLDKNETKEIAKSLKWSEKLPISRPVCKPEYIFKSGGSKINIWRTTRIAEDQNGVLLSLPGQACRCLDLVIARLEILINNRFGELIAWPVVKNIFTMYSEAEVIDFETGKHFRVQRRAGSNHADVQPLTSDDTRVMKEIFQGKWTWERRAAVVVVGGRRIAASMNGQPHGAGAIKGNDFPGHFCLHFLGSKTHATGKVDIDHQKMVLKAGGKN
ncbi:MAG: hypothetical protein ACM3UZ_04215 [Acidobacteriota bacterium]